MNDNNKIFSCSEIIEKKIMRIGTRVLIVMFVLFIANCILNVILYQSLKKKVFYTYYKNINVLEQLYNVRIEHGKVSPILPKNKDAE